MSSSLSRTEQTATLLVDNGHIVTGASPGKLRQLNGSGKLYVGGTAAPADADSGVNGFPGMRGCISDLSVGKLLSVEMVLKAKVGRNVDSCANSA